VGYGLSPCGLRRQNPVKKQQGDSNAPYMGGLVRERNGIATIVNGPLDHVHLLLSLPTTESLADLHPPNGSRGNGNSAGKRDTRPSR
jgi:hypothetical protein